MGHKERNLYADLAERADGSPVIEWVDEAPAAESVHPPDKNLPLKIAVVIALFAASTAYFSGASIASRSLHS